MTKPKKYDRFERMADAEYKKWLKGPQEKGWLSLASKLLRREHRLVVRMVQKVADWQGEQLADGEDAIAVILDQLKKRAV